VFVLSMILLLKQLSKRTQSRLKSEMSQEGGGGGEPTRLKSQLSSDPTN
jgi:hypothetical protein